LFSRVLNPYTTTKRVEIRKSRLRAMTAFVRGGCIVFAGKGVFGAQIGMKGVEPEFDFKIGTMEDGTESIAYGLVSLFNWAVLV
jgi:hypothetical protein